MAHARTTASSARLAPTFAAIVSAITLADPESSISLPKIAPSMNNGKNLARYLPSSTMNTCV